MRYTPLVLVLLCSCASPSAVFFVPTHNPITYTGPVDLQLCERAPQDPRLTEDGNIMLGHSYYRGTRLPSENEIRRQARKVGADMVLYSWQCIGQQERHAVVTVPNPPQQVDSYSSGTVTAPNGGSYYYNGVTTTTVPGGSSSYDIPYMVSVYNVFEVYLSTRGAYDKLPNVAAPASPEAHR